MTQGSIAEHLFELTRQSARLIRKDRFRTKADTKTNAVGEPEDVTYLDRRVEAFAQGRWKELFPGVPLIGEETFTDRPRVTAGTYGTCDPIDGTQALIRRQSHGIGSMFAYVDNGQVISACVADVVAQEMYWYGENALEVVRHAPQSFYDNAGDVQMLGEHGFDLPLAEQRLMIGLHPDEYGPVGRRLTAMSKRGGLFKDIEIDHGSIGIRAARVWKGEVGGLMMKPRYATPWDDTPVIGFFKKLDFAFIMIDPEDGPIAEFDPPLLTAPRYVDFTTLVIHRSRLPEFWAWMKG